MSQIFSKGWDTWLRVFLLLGALGVLGAAGIAFGLVASDFSTRRAIVVDQPVPFSHEHHVAGLGIDCRYCHTSVETAPVAGLPSTETCMSCHSQLWTDAALLAPVRESFARREPIRWSRVHDLPDFVYFDHSIHVHAGVGCVACHGEVDRMPLMHKARTLDMAFCIDCHRDPAPRLRPREQVFNMRWQPAADPAATGQRLARRLGIAGRDLTHCYACHR